MAPVNVCPGGPASTQRQRIVATAASGPRRSTSIEIDAHFDAAVLVVGLAQDVGDRLPPAVHLPIADARGRCGIEVQGGNRVGIAAADCIDVAPDLDADLVLDGLG